MPLRFIASIAILTAALNIGCSIIEAAPAEAPAPEIQPEKLVGKLLIDVIKQYHLDACPMWDEPNLPPGEDMKKTFFMKSGDLIVTFDNSSAFLIKTARFVPSTETAAQRYQRVGDQWDDYVKAHTDPSRGKFGESGTSAK